MTPESNVNVLPGQLGQIVESVFEAMLGLEAGTVDEPWFPGEERLTAAVHLAGSWTGAVMFECDRQQACQFANRFLSMDLSSSVDDVVRDVLGELANMIGGNLKSIMTPGILLSIPTVIDGSDYRLRFCGVQARERIAVRSAEGVVWVTILNTEAPLIEN